jgi:hypothetical protein
MRNTRSTLTFLRFGSSAVPKLASEANTYVESPGMSNLRAFPVAWALLMPSRIRADVVSNAAVPGSPAVSFAGNVSLTSGQPAPSTETVPRVTVEPALDCPGTPGWSTKASEMLSKYIPLFELQPSEIPKRKHCCVTPISRWSESGIPLGFDVLSGKPLS